MVHVDVASSNVESIGYDPAQDRLEVRFKNGGLYSYRGVSHDEYTTLMAAPSIGSHLSKHIIKAGKAVTKE